MAADRRPGPAEGRGRAGGARPPRGAAGDAPALTDRRRLPANARVAAAELEGQVASERFVAGERRAVAAPLADLRAAPDGARDRQLLCGDAVRVFEDRSGWAFVQAAKDRAVGYVASEALGPDIEATDTVGVRGTHLYPAPEVKAEPVAALSFAARLRIVSARGRFAETDGGYFVPRAHLRPVGQAFRDPATVAQIFYGTPYLWGGNSGAGIDCSGLVQLACRAADRPCPADSDQQAVETGRALPEETPTERGDLLFWAGHVAIAVDGEVMIHANGHHMAVAYEPIATAVRRIEVQGDGPLTGRRRP